MSGQSVTVDIARLPWMDVLITFNDDDDDDCNQHGAENKGCPLSAYDRVRGQGLQRGSYIDYSAEWDNRTTPLHLFLMCYGPYSYNGPCCFPKETSSSWYLKAAARCDPKWC